jgi:hypothetical protein
MLREFPLVTQPAYLIGTDIGSITVTKRFGMPLQARCAEYEQTTDKIPGIACPELAENIPQIASSEQYGL